MAFYGYTPISGTGTVDTDPNTGTSYRFDQSNYTWTPISSGVNQAPQTVAPVAPTNQAPAPAPASSGGGGGGGGNPYDRNRDPDMWARAEGYSGYQDFLDQGAGRSVSDEQRRYEEEQRNQINAGWDQYTNQLNEMLNVGIPGQRAAQEQLAGSTYTSGVNQLETQKGASERQLQEQQASNLKDLAENVRNLFTSGNIYLGSRGAGDSSAANQYAYAIGKMGTKARGDIQSQVSSRLNQISDIYNQEVNRLESEKNAQMANIANWFNEQQNAIRGQIGQAGLGRSQDLQALATNVYNQAMQAMQQLQAQQAERRSVLEQWAANNSQSVQELMGNMQAVGSSVPQFQGINAPTTFTSPEGSAYVQPSYTGSSETDIFGNPIQ